jgi:hypothetical protein
VDEGGDVIVVIEKEAGEANSTSGLGHLVVLKRMATEPFKAALGRLKDHIKYHITGKEPSGISNGETVHQIKKLMKDLESEKRGQAEEMKAILAQKGEEQYFVHPYSGHVYAVTGRYPYRIAGLLDSVWGLLDGVAAPVSLLFNGGPKAAGLAYTTYDVWGQPVYGMPIRAYKESEEERFMESMERQEAPFAKYVDPRWGEAPYPGTVKRGMAPPRYIIDKPSGWVDGLLGDGASYSIWKLDSVLTGHWWGSNYGVPYYGKNGKLKMALGRHQWEAEDQYQKLQAAGVVAAPYNGTVDPTAFGFDMAARMG